MKKLIWFGLLVGIRGLLRATPSLAVSIDFEPSAQTVLLGQPLAVDIVVSGLGGGSSLGAFDFDVTFNPAFLAPTGVTFGPFLGDPDPGLFEVLTGVTFLSGVANLFEVSLLEPAELPVQPASFTLATLSFATLASGTSALGLSNMVFGDASGEPLTATAVSGSVEVVPNANVVPEPGTCLLLATGCVGLLARGWRRRQRAA